MTIPAYIASGVGTIVILLVRHSVKQIIGRAMDKMSDIHAELKEHKDKCDKVDKNVLDVRIMQLSEEQEKMRKFNHWMAEAIIRLAAQQGIQLPVRPD